ncbi:MAG TPA: hypothetical protein VFN57_19420 [Thermomicrobiaceae bacterium]|nr:hypothetical protein [Thermomicrobiaceae bacterium]
MVAAQVDRADWHVVPGARSATMSAPATRRAADLRLLAAANSAAPTPAPYRGAADPFERAGLRVGRAIGRLGRRRPAAAASATIRADRTDSAAAPASSAARLDWGQVKQTLDVVDSLPPLRALAESLLGPWGLDLVVVAGVALGLLYPGNPLGIAAGHGELFDLAMPLLKVALAAVLSPLAVDLALALLGLGRLVWSRHAPAARPALAG